ncbi:hypothetical protein [Klebsiella aerogenes]|uniref:hypothetical protein n=1 Tax=Klebsiella aerogenes TaxID=548 RepID=UPI001866376B|nr:hypothetical protein [Klebsiella aerogenes]
MNINHKPSLCLLASFVINPFTMVLADDSGKYSTKSFIINQPITSTLKNYNLATAEPLPVNADSSYKIPVTTDTSSAHPPVQDSKSEVGGYILNQQLVNQIARPFPDFGVVIGQGWNSFLNRQSANICIEGATESLLGTQLNSSVSSVEDRASYYEALSASAGASYGPFSGSGGYSKENNFSTYDANVVINVVVDTGGFFIKPATDKGIQLSSYALSLLNTKDSVDGVSRFLQACGDSFVTTIRNGGRMTAVLNISNVSNSQKEEIKAQASAGIGILSANANFRKSIETATSDNKLRVSFEQVGGTFNGSPISVQDFLDKFAQYKVDQTYNPRPYVFYTINYRTLPNWPSGKDNRVSPVDQNYYVLSYYNFMQLTSDYDRYLQKPSLYNNFLSGGDGELNQLRDLALTYARNLDFTIWECANIFDCSTTVINKIDDSLKVTEHSTENLASLKLILNDAALTEYVTIGQDRTTVSDNSKLDTDLKTETKDITATGTQQNTIIPKITLNYYRLLASLPLLKVNDVIEFKTPLKSTGLIENDDVVLKAFRGWLIANRIRPVSNNYCQNAASHPLCLSSKEMNEIASLINVNLNAIRTANPANPSVAIPSPPPVKTVPPERHRSDDPCDRRPGRCPAR